MTQLVVLRRHRDWENTTWTDYCTVPQGIDAEMALRAAIADFLLTDDGKQAIRDTMEDFNWGDAVMILPNETWEKHGVRFISPHEPVTIMGRSEVDVRQDEVLIPATYW